MERAMELSESIENPFCKSLAQARIASRVFDHGQSHTAKDKYHPVFSWKYGS
jgi:hypothetical protein